MRAYIITTFQITKLLVRRYFRSRTAIFFSVFFPLMLLFVFGSIYGKSGGTSFKVAVINSSQTAFSKQFVTNLSKIKALDIQTGVGSLSDAKDRMNKSQLDSVIELPSNFGQPNAQHFAGGTATVLYDQNNAQAGQTVASILQSALAGINTQLTQIQPPLTVATKSTDTKGLSSFDYVFSGLLGFSLLGLGIFGPINMLPAEKKTGALTRLRVTPLHPAQFIVAYMLSVLATGALSIAVMFLVAVQFFHFHMVGNYLVFALFSLFGAIMVFGIGVGVGGWAKDERQAAPLGNIVSFPMMFLSGVFFPRFLMPDWLQHITNFIPLSPVVDGIRMILTEGKSFSDLGPQLGLIAIWIVVIYAAAFRAFRWE